MPRLDWYVYEGNKIWYKACSKPTCKEEFEVVADDFDSARELMREHFSTNCYGSAKDMLSAWCRSCMTNAHDKRNGNGVHRETLLEKQGGGCAICEQKISFKAKNAATDHDHKTTMVRGILCTHCNTRMIAVDNDEWLAKAVAYRDKHRNI